MKETGHFLICLAVVAVATMLCGPPRKNVLEHGAGICLDHAERVDEHQPEMILLGNSLLERGVDVGEFSRATGMKTMAIAQPGSATAYWYLILKNVLPAAVHRARTVAVFFPDDLLTRPSFRVRGRHDKRIDRLAGANEEVLDRLAYLNDLTMPLRFFGRRWSLFQKRDRCADVLEWFVKERLARRLLGLRRRGADHAIRRVFAEKNLDPQLATLRQINAEAAPDKSAYDFARRVDDSFLPEMIRLSREHGYQLVFIRMKARRDCVPGREPPELTRYVADLRAYLAEQEVPLLDFSDDQRIQEQHYANGNHLKGEGRRLFTAILAEALKSGV
ncbi:MAG: hypothetical protein JXB04_12265 [Kiritimatiellae bacterium]|nr:hypothetical protein [Kiritimatiellia bacterium]